MACPECRSDSVLASSARGDRGRFDAMIVALRADVLAAAAMISNDAHVRRLYQQKITEAARQIESEAINGRISWAEAAERARVLRNDTLNVLRGRTSPVGLALAESMKREGLTRETLLSRYAERLFGQGARFQDLSPDQQNRVYAKIVERAGASNPRVNAALARWSRAAKGLIVLSLGVAVYNVATAEDPAAQAVEEGAVLGAGVAGGVAGGAAAGLICGPGAPVCVTIGAFVGGALAAFGMSSLF